MNHPTTAAILSMPSRGAARLKRAVVSTAIAAFFGAIMVAGIGGAGSAHADTWLDEWHDYDGSHIEIYRDDNGNLYVWGVEADGENWVFTFEGNPNPEDPDGDTPMTPETIKELIKKVAGEMSEPEVAFWDNFLGTYLTGKGEGLIPVYNPFDIANTYDDGTGGGGSGIDGTGGDVLEQLRNSGGGMPTNDDEERDDFGTETPKDGMYDDVMVGPPELINPNPTLSGERTADAVAP